MFVTGIYVFVTKNGSTRPPALLLSHISHVHLCLDVPQLSIIAKEKMKKMKIKKRISVSLLLLCGTGFSSDADIHSLHISLAKIGILLLLLNLLLVLLVHGGPEEEFLHSVAWYMFKFCDL